jgi:putative transposase
VTALGRAEQTGDLELTGLMVGGAELEQPKPDGRRPWLTLIEDDHSRAVAGYAVNLGAPSALTTALAFRQAIWRKPWPGWHVCGIPDAFHVDHGSDFTSAHLEQVMADLKIRAYFSLPGQPRGRGKVERIFGTINQMCLPALPGYAPRGTPDRAGQARLTLAELDAAIGLFIREVYNLTPQGEIHPDGIHFQGLRYLDPVLAAHQEQQRPGRMPVQDDAVPLATPPLRLYRTE